MKLLMRLAPILLGFVLTTAGCALNNQFEDAVGACTGQPLSCFHNRFGPTKGLLETGPRGNIYRFDYFFRDLYGTCFGNVVLDSSTGLISGGYLDGEGCEFY